MKNKVAEIFIPGPSGRIQAKYIRSVKKNPPVALVLQPHPQYGGTMNNRVVYEIFNSYLLKKRFTFFVAKLGFLIISFK